MLSSVADFAEIYGMSQISTLTFFRYNRFITRCWGFLMMQFAHRPLSQAKGCQFYKLMGSGKGRGFNPWPDWSVYSLLQVWENEKYAEEFFRQARLVARYDRRAEERWTIYLKNISAKGAWSGQQPFLPADSPDPQNNYIAVITRATIRPRHLRKFWNYVPLSEKPLSEARGLIYTKGIGEVPVTQMATFSIWENMESLHEFAYASKEHRGAIERTRQYDWYREEMFSRFQPYRSEGTWFGRIMLPGINVSPDSSRFPR